LASAQVGRKTEFQSNPCGSHLNACLRAQVREKAVNKATTPASKVGECWTSKQVIAEGNYPVIAVPRKKFS
jgi:hypothetical protein